MIVLFSKRVLPPDGRHKKTWMILLSVGGWKERRHRVWGSGSRYSSITASSGTRAAPASGRRLGKCKPNGPLAGRAKQPTRSRRRRGGGTHPAAPNAAAMNGGLGFQTAPDFLTRRQHGNYSTAAPNPASNFTEFTKSCESHRLLESASFHQRVKRRTERTRLEVRIGVISGDYSIFSAYVPS